MLHTLRNKVSKFSRGVRRAMILGVIGMALPAVAMAYNPNSPVYDATKPSLTRDAQGNQICTPADGADYNSCGSMTGPVFDAFKNTNGYGEERNFLTISDGTNDANPIDNNYSDKLAAVPGHEYWLRIYVHNNANQGTNCAPEHVLPVTGNCSQLDAGSTGIATDTHVSVDFNKGRANGHDLKAYIDAKDAKGNQIAQTYDGAQLTNDNTQFRLEYVPNSTKVLTAKQNTNLQTAPSDDIANTGGMRIGENFDGTVDGSGSYPGCFDFVSRVYVKVVVKAPVLTVKKVAYIAGQSGAANRIDGKTVAANTNVTWKVYVSNIGNDVADDLTVRDMLPAGSNFTKDTLKFYDVSENGKVQNSGNENIFFNQGGLNAGQYRSLTDTEAATLNDSNNDNWKYNVLYTYRTTIAADNSICSLTNHAFARAAGIDETSASSTINIDRNGDQPGNGCDQPVVTSFNCNGLTVNLLNDRTYRFTAAPAVQNVTINNYIFTFGDGATSTVTSATTDHTFAAAGTYTASVKIVTSAGTTQDVCQVAVTVPATPPATPASTTGKPSMLPNTGNGAAGILGIFAATTVAGALVHRFILSRRYN